MRYHLRLVGKADRDFLYRLKEACLKEYVAASFDPAASQVVVAFGRDVGQLAVDGGQSEIILSGIYLLPAYQGQGLGGQVLADLLTDARQRGLPVGLQVLLGNPARALYGRLGFRITAMTATHYMMRAE